MNRLTVNTKLEIKSNAYCLLRGTAIPAGPMHITIRERTSYLQYRPVHFQRYLLLVQLQSYSDVYTLFGKSQ